MRGFKNTYKGQKVKEHKNRRESLDDIMYKFFIHYRKDPEFLKEDFGFNVDAELEYDFAMSEYDSEYNFAIKGKKLA